MIYPVILCGGAGTRLWPVSRKSYPKQFAALLGDQTLFQAAALRLSGQGFAGPIIVTNAEFRFIAAQQLAEIGITPSAILIEPEARSTAPAILAATLWALGQNPEAMLVVAPSDHAIPDAEGFREAIARGVSAAEAGQIVTFGITPSRPETGYGYLEVAQELGAQTGPMPLRGFVEKPDIDRAKSMLRDGNFFWNAGVFLFRAQVMQAAFSRLARDVCGPVTQAIDQAETDFGFLRLAREPWAQAPDISIDYAVMERASNLSVVPFSGDWSDLGGWDSIWENGARDAQGVALSGQARAIDCTDSLLRSESDGMALVGIGLQGIIAVATSDAVLVADMSRAQDVRLAVSKLREVGARQAELFPKEHRPWGWFESLTLGDGFQVKRIYVHPGAALSLQSHQHRAEHWIVVQGTAEVTIGAQVRRVGANQSVYIPLGEKHRLANPTQEELVLIEVQTGSYFGEDDIIRYEDAYARIPR